MGRRQSAANTATLFEYGGDTILAYKFEGRWYHPTDVHNMRRLNIKEFENALAYTRWMLRRRARRGDDLPGWWRDEEAEQI